MHLGERAVGDFRILTAATPAGRNGYVAAVIVKQVEGNGAVSRNVYTDLSIADGFCFEDPKAALRYAFDVGHRAVRQAAQVGNQGQH